MKKIEGLYRSYCHERENRNAGVPHGREQDEGIAGIFESKLNAEDYFTAEEMLNDLIAETEEKALQPVPNTPPGLGKELFAE